MNPHAVSKRYIHAVINVSQGWMSGGAGGHAHAIGGTRAASMDLSDLVGGSARDLWNEAGHQDDNHFLLDMAAEYFN